MANVIARAGAWLRRAAAEGAWRMAYGRSITSGAVFEIPFGNGWERGLRLVGPVDGRAVPAAFACVMSFARATSQCYPAHKRVTPGGKHETVTTSPASRLLRTPNSYQNFDQFLFNVVASMGFDGEALAIILRDDRGAPASLHQVLRGHWQPCVDPETLAVFYRVGNMAMDQPFRLDAGDQLIPARDVIHFRQYCPRHPLVGETDLAAAALAMGVNVSLSQSQAAFFANMARPSGILSTDQGLTKDQMTRLRTAFKEQSAGLAQGELPILGNGLKFQAMMINSVDAQLIESQRMSVEDIARVKGVPLPVIGDLSKATLNNTEQLINLWLSVSLGSLLENLERTLDRAFGFERGDYVELDTEALLRSDLLQRIDARTKGIAGGLYAPNEARELEGLDPKAGGNEPMMQQQMTPISKLGKIADQAAAPPPAPAAPAPANDDDAEAKAAARAERAAMLAALERLATPAPPIAPPPIDPALVAILERIATPPAPPPIDPTLAAILVQLATPPAPPVADHPGGNPDPMEFDAARAADLLRARLGETAHG